MMNEKWKPIKGYETVYEVSDNGAVRRKRKSNSGDVGSYLRQVTDKAGYKRVCLCNDGKSKKHFVHRLVADAFLDGEGCDVNHINGNKGDNRATNLEWCSHKENMVKAVETGLIKGKSVLQIANNKVIDVFASLADAAKKTNASKSNISKCCNGKRKTANGYEWRWAELCLEGANNEG